MTGTPVKYSVWPVKEKTITQGYRSGHSAIDIGTPVGEPVRSPTTTKVVKTGFDATGYGNYAVLQDSAGDQIYLGHFSQPAQVKPGTILNPGDVVGVTGSTGNSTGPHLHYEVRTAGGGGFINPMGLYDVPLGTQGTNLPASKPGVSGILPTTINPSMFEPLPGDVKKNTTPISAGNIVSSALKEVLPQVMGPFWKEDTQTVDWPRLIVVVLGGGMIILGLYAWVQTEGARVAAKVTGGALKGVVSG
jgi:hypothetical protein